MKIYKKRWMQSGIALICSLAIVLSVFPVFADNEEIKNLPVHLMNSQMQRQMKKSSTKI